MKPIKSIVLKYKAPHGMAVLDKESIVELPMLHTYYLSENKPEYWDKENPDNTEHN